MPKAPYKKENQKTIRVTFTIYKQDLEKLESLAKKLNLKKSKLLRLLINNLYRRIN